MGNMSYSDYLMQKKSRQSKGFVRFSEVSLAHILSAITFCPECNLDYRIVRSTSDAIGDEEYIEVFEKSDGNAPTTFSPIKVDIMSSSVLRNYQIDRLLKKVYTRFKNQKLLTRPQVPLSLDETILLSSLTRAVDASRRNFEFSDGDMQFYDIKRRVFDKTLQFNVFRKIYNWDSRVISKNCENVLVSILADLNYFGKRYKNLSLDFLTQNHSNFSDAMFDLQSLNKLIHASTNKDNVDNDFICSQIGYLGDKLCADLSLLYGRTLARACKFSSDQISSKFKIIPGDFSYGIKTKVGERDAELISYDIDSAINKFGSISSLVFQPWWPKSFTRDYTKSDIEKMASIDYWYVQDRKMPIFFPINKKPDLEPGIPNGVCMSCYLDSAPRISYDL